MRGKVMALALAAVFTLGLAAQETKAPVDPTFSWGLDNIKVDWWGIVPTGPVLKFGYGSLGLVPGLRSDILAKAGVGYESYSIFRDENTRDPIFKKDAPAIEKPDGQIELGFRQGLLPLDAKRDLLSAFAYVNGRASKYFGTPLAAGTSFDDRYDEAMASFLGGLKLNDSEASPNGVMSGSNILFEAEWGPSFLSVQGTDFARAGLRALQYIPVFDLGGDRNLLSGYLVFGASVKYADGAKEPIFVLEGTDVRGYQIGLDSKLRAWGTVEGRLNLPSALGRSDILPVLFVFADAGWYQGFANLRSASPWADASGPLASVGGGLGVNVFNFATPYVAIGFPLVSQDSTGKTLTTSTPYTLGFGFSLHPEDVFDWL
ncbi:MAG TPA: hypothetical protein VMV83_05965 [Rectinemataceae bacterium]|nr:hypothetical protein [Rectinemataceae bacterium]